MNQWENIGRFATLTNISLEKLRQCCLERETGKKKLEKKRYKTMDRDYVTFNYLNMDGLEETNVLLNIISRFEERRGRRNEMRNEYEMKKLRKEKERIEEEKRQCEEAKRKYNDRLTLIKENYLIKRQKDESRRRFQKRILHLQEVAARFYDSLLLRIYFKKLRQTLLNMKEKAAMAERNYSLKLLSKSLKSIAEYSNQKIQLKMQLAAQFYQTKTFHFVFQILSQIRYEAQKKCLEASVFHERRILRIYFRVWQKDTQDRLLIRMTQIEAANLHYRRKLMNFGFLKLMKWRETHRQLLHQRDMRFRLRSAVKRVLPSFTPPTSSDEDD